MLNLRKSICSSLLLSLFFLASTSFAQRPKLKAVEDSGLDNLIQESNSLSVLQESSVQSEEAESLRVYGVKVGMVGDQSIKINTQGQEFDYQLGPDTPVLGASFSYIPWQRQTEVGLDLNLQYLTQRGQGAGVKNDPVQLHLAFFEPSLFVQHHLGQYFTPRVGLGWGVVGIFQRGYENESTSSSQGYGFYQAALDFNINRIRFFHSDLDWGLTLEHRRALTSTSALGAKEMQKTSLGVHLQL